MSDEKRDDEAAEVSSDMIACAEQLIEEYGWSKEDVLETLKRVLND